VYYACRTYKEKSKEKCTKHSIREDVLESAVLTVLQAQVAWIDSLSGIVDEINNAPVVDTQSARIKKLLTDKRKELVRTKQLSDGLYIDWKHGDINHEDYRRMKARFDEQIQAIKSNIENLEEEQHCMGQGVTTEEDIFKEFLKYKNIQKLERNVLVELVDTIYVHENKEITIKFRYEDDLKRIAEFVEINSEKTSSPDAQNFFAQSCG
jgi:predicted  nucleic acid-binding Zn-ribbon protein